jgi:hypothetical protein
MPWPRGRKQAPEHVAARLGWAKGHHHSKQHRARIADSQRRRWAALKAESPKG